jgi:transposase
MKVGVLKDRDSLQDLNSTVTTIMHIVHFLCTEATQLRRHLYTRFLLRESSSSPKSRTLLLSSRANHNVCILFTAARHVKQGAELHESQGRETVKYCHEPCGTRKQDCEGEDHQNFTRPDRPWSKTGVWRLREQSECKVWSWVPWDSQPTISLLAKTSINLAVRQAVSQSVVI